MWATTSLAASRSALRAGYRSWPTTDGPGANAETARTRDYLARIRGSGMEFSWLRAPGRASHVRSHAEQISRELKRSCQRDQVTAGQHVRLDAEPVPGERPLKLDGEEPVVRSDHDPNRDGRPSVKVADRPEDHLGLGALMRLPGGRDLGRDVMQEIDGRVELGAVATLFGCDRARLERSSVSPPCAWRLTRRRDHRVHEYEGTYRDVR